MGTASFVKYKQGPQQNPTQQKLYRLTYPDAIVDGEGRFDSMGFCGQSLEQQFVENTYPVEGEVKMMYRYGGSFMGTMTETNRWVKMYRSDKLDIVVNQDCWYGSEARFADIILPACTNLERDDIGEWAACGGYTTNSHCGCNWRVIVREQKCIEPIGESKTDYEILSLISDRLGMGELFTEGKSDLDWCKAFFDSSELAKKGMISWEELNEKGYYIVPVPDDYIPTPGMRWYYEGRESDTPDPGNPKRGTDKAHELGTDSGKIEFESLSLKRLAKDDDERKPVPQWIPSWEGRESDLYAKYALQLISPHPRFSFHTHYDHHTQWLNEIPGHRIQKDGYAWWPIRVNPADAQARGVKDGDIVELYNDRGSVLGAAVVTERVPTGVIHSYGCSARYDPVDDSDNATDRAGCVNILTSKRTVSKRVPGMAPNSCLCELRVWEGGK
jgi:trimethylamine-N-oxide reductase (cytochrome c)